MAARTLGTPTRTNAAALDVGLDTLVWADGGTLAGVRPFSLRMHQMHDALQRPDAPAAEFLALLRLCVPDGAVWTAPDGTSGTVDEDYRLDLPAPRVWIVFQHAQFLLAAALTAVEASRKNGDAGETTAEPIPVSPPMTSSNTPSPASPARSGRTGGRSTTRRSTACSTPSIG